MVDLQGLTGLIVIVIVGLVLLAVYRYLSGAGKGAVCGASVSWWAVVESFFDGGIFGGGGGNGGCASNLVCVEGICVEKSQPGSTCLTNSQCANDACGHNGAPEAPLVCCKSGSYRLDDGYYLCRDQPLGEPCLDNSQVTFTWCAAGLWCDTSTTPGICKALLPPGGPCPTNDDSVCANGLCNTQGPVDDGYPYVCCPGGQQVYSASRATYYCSNNGLGDLCWQGVYPYEDDWCGGGLHCRTNPNNSNQYTCQN